MVPNDVDDDDDDGLAENMYIDVSNPLHILMGECLLDSVRWWGLFVPMNLSEESYAEPAMTAKVHIICVYRFQNHLLWVMAS